MEDEVGVGAAEEFESGACCCHGWVQVSLDCCGGFFLLIFCDGLSGARREACKG